MEQQPTRKTIIADTARSLGWEVERIDLRKNTALLRKGSQQATALLWRGISAEEAIQQVRLAVGHHPAPARKKAL